MKSIDIIYFKAGGGHISVARSIKAQLNLEGYNVRLLDLREDIPSLANKDIIYKITGIRFESFYNFLLKHDLTYGISKWLKFGQFLIRCLHKRIVAGLSEFWNKEGISDIVLSVIPNFNRQIFESINGKAKMFTVMCDLADNPPHFWNEPDLDINLIVPTEFAFNQAVDLGTKHVSRISGPIVHPKFYSYASTYFSHKRNIKQTFGFDPDKPVVVVAFGGSGSNRMYKFAQHLESYSIYSPEIQCLFICGHNDKLHDKLLDLKRNSGYTLPWNIFSFVDNVPYYLSCGDLFIGKPGPNSIAEAIVMGLPLFLEDHRTMSQEQYNIYWVEDHELGISTSDLSSCISKLRSTLDYHLDHYKESIKHMNNRGIFEISKILMN